MMNILTFYQLIADYAKSVNKSILYFRTETNDPEELEELYKFYENKVPIEVYAALMSEKENFMLFDHVSTALKEAENFFPFHADLLEDEKHLFVYVHVFDEQGNSMFENV